MSVSEAQIGRLPSYQELENALINGAAAIQCLTDERNHLRSRVDAQEGELMSLRSTNEALRRQITMIGDSYIKFATSCVTQLQYVENAMQQVQITDTDLRSSG
jgi:hypothetical protein